MEFSFSQNHHFFLIALFMFFMLSFEMSLDDVTFNRHSFPPGFVFGTSSSAYQYEGAYKEDGKGPSIWDTFTHQHKGKILDESNGDVALDSYHRHKEDMEVMKRMGVDAFRLSISWPRILPYGSLDKGVNWRGIYHYNNVINELISNGIQPYVTLFHWDLPQPLEDKYRGFLDSSIIKDYQDYVDVCFQYFGDRVKHWITFNEPHIFTTHGYVLGTSAPGHSNNPGTEPYIVAHNLLLAHAHAVKLYKQKYQKTQNGTIGITLDSGWYLPLNNTKVDEEAVHRALDFELGWYMDPLTEGDYPFTMRALVRDRLPVFTVEEKALVKGSFDFIGINYYTSSYCYAIEYSEKPNKSYITDSFTAFTYYSNGVPIGPQAGSSWLHVYPKGIKDLLLYIKEKYSHPLIYITENGVDEVNNASISLKEALNDMMRIDYHRDHLINVRSAIIQGADVRGYFVWTLLDDFEWDSGYTVRFGIHYIDYNNNLKRIPKKSARWFRDFLKSKKANGSQGAEII